MSVWAKRQGLLGRHKHLQSDILDPDTATVEVGGSISATDGTTTVNPTTSIRVPAGTLTDLTGGAAGVGRVFQLVGPFAIAWNTPGLVNPAQVGLELVALGVGTVLIQAWAMQGADWDGTGTILQMLVGTSSAGRRNIQYSLLPSQDGFEMDASYKAGPALFLPQIAGANEYLVAAVYVDDAVTTGTADIYAIVAAPAS